MEIACSLDEDGFIGKGEGGKVGNEVFSIPIKVGFWNGEILLMLKELVANCNELADVVREKEVVKTCVIGFLQSAGLLEIGDDERFVRHLCLCV